MVKLLCRTRTRILFLVRWEALVQDPVRQQALFPIQMEEKGLGPVQDDAAPSPPGPAPSPTAAAPNTCPQSTNVMSFDTSKMASSLNEAMNTFPNLLRKDGSTLVAMLDGDTGTPPTAAENKNMTLLPSNCNTLECSGCWLNIVNQFARQGDQDWRDVADLHSTLNSSCVLQQNIETSPPNPSLVSQIQKTFSATSSRGKRQAATNSTLLGTVANVECYQKGNVLSGSGNWCGLCSLCWRFRQLPSSYFPRYINEIGCVDSDNTCLSSFGTCRLITQPVAVMVQSDSGWKQITVQSSTGCDCQITSSSTLSQLVST
ncbi:unnamed protein product, partial [Mesorhabditis spiculigera]